jgi:cobalamin biosynthesis protein CobW
VVVVNAEQVAEGRDLEGTFEQQVSSADLLVLNKLDLVVEDSLACLEGKLESMAPGAPVIRSIHGQIDTKVVFPPTPAKATLLKRKSKPELVSHTHEAFESQELTFPDNITPEQLLQQLQALQALRIKGIVNTSEGPKLVQGVGPRVDLSPPPTNLPREIIGRLIVIRKK